MVLAYARMNLIAVTVQRIGSANAAGRVCRLSGKAVAKWVAAGRLPRTEHTGETNYADQLSAAVGGAITADALRREGYPMVGAGR